MIVKTIFIATSPNKINIHIIIRLMWSKAHGLKLFGYNIDLSF